MAPPQWAYQVENFVPKPDEELVCSVCHAIFCDPVICPCDHVFCRVCITKWLQNNRNCPICRKRVPRYSIKQMVPIVKNLIMKLTLSCRNKEHGCDAQFTLEGCESHMKECSFELVQCKNKPCKEKLFRKDVDEHEANGCLHRYIKCKLCGSKMSSLSSPEDHDCIKSLLLRLRRKNGIIRKKNNKMKELRNEIKNLKDTARNSADSEPSTLSSVSQDDILINIADMESLSSSSFDSDDTSDSIIAIFANTESDNDSDGNQSFSGYMDVQENNNNESSHDANEYRNAESQTVDDQDENQNDSHNGNDSGHENNSVAFETPDSAVNEREEKSRSRRPAKRRHPPPLSSTSDDEQGSEERQSLPSPKRCWRTETNERNNAGDSSNGYMDAGPSQSCTFTAECVASNDGASTSNTKWRFRSKAKLDEKNLKNKKSSSLSKSPSQGKAVFQRTLALLEQYNLDSDPEWLPECPGRCGNDALPDSDSSFDVDAASDSSSSQSDFDYFSGSGNDSNDAVRNILKELYSTSEDDTDWRPGLED